MKERSIASRLLAAFVDYLVIWIISMPFYSLDIAYDNKFLISLLVGGLYYSIGNSKITTGATLGKRAFGLRVRSVVARDSITVWQSALRYLASFGILILLESVPKQYLLTSSVVSSALFLELNMGIAMAYFLANIAMLPARKDRRLFHDLICGTEVYRIAELNQENQNIEPAEIKSLYILPILAALLAVSLWSYSLPKGEMLKSIFRYKYVMEKQFSLREINFQFLDNKFGIAALDISKDERVTNWREEKAREILLYLKDQGLLDSGDVKYFDLLLLSYIPEKPSSNNLIGEPKVVRLDVDSMEVVSLSPK